MNVNDPIRDMLQKLSRAQLRRVQGAVSGKPVPGELDERQRALVARYAVDGNHRDTHEHIPGRLGAAKLAAPMRGKIEEYEADCKLKASYVREYIHDVLEMCPVDHFVPTGDGDGSWLIDMDALRALPQRVKRLIEYIDFTRDGFARVTFISKTAALALAARFTLMQQDGTVATLPWEKLAGEIGVGKSGAAAIEERIAEVRDGGFQGVSGQPLQAEGAPVADSPVLQETGTGDPVDVEELRDGGAGRKHAG